MVTVLKNFIILTIDPDDRIIRGGCLVIEHGKITAIGPMESIQSPLGAEVVDGHGIMAVMPGFVDAHSHSSLLRGYTENLNLMSWLPEYQREHQVLTPEDAYWASLLCYLEALKGGTTTVLDMYRYMDRCADAAQTLGLRVHLAPYVADAANKDFFETLAQNELLLAKYHGKSNGRIKALVGLEHLFYCTPQAYRRATAMAEHYDVLLHTHSSELKSEVEAVHAHFGKLPIHQLDEYGAIGPRTLLAHGVWLEESEMNCLADRGVAGVVLCPTSNAKLAGGIPPYGRYVEKGITTGLGTDGPISNNSLSMWELMKFGSLQQKLLNYDAAALPALECLRLATIGGAKLLREDRSIGSLEVGKAADLFTINLWQPHLMPLLRDDDHDPLPWNLVYAGRASDVVDVWVNGERLIHNGKSTKVDEDLILKKIQAQTASLLERRKSTRSVSMASMAYVAPDQ